MTAGDRVRGETGRVELFPPLPHLLFSHREGVLWLFTEDLEFKKDTLSMYSYMCVWVCANVSVQKWEPRGGIRMLKDTGHKGVLFFKINPSKPHDSMTGEAFSRSKLS